MRRWVVMPPYPRGGGGGMLRISSDVDDRMGAKTKTPINPRDKNLFIHHTLWSYRESSYCFKYAQNSSYPEIYFQIFLPKKNPGIKNFNPPQNQPRPQGFSHFLREKPWGRGCPKTLRSSPSFEIRSTPLPTWSPLCEYEIKIDH